ncbi:MAG: zinc ribbon domain-containing protein [Candidatus Thermoplasmatota archaeon]|nr:zinc ribbon domain-containing protein [Candidatus Thermoplasmatota archaeon]
MTSKTKRTKECPSCGWTLAHGDKTCPQCGKELTNNRGKSGKKKSKPTKSSRLECPNCGASILRSSKICPLCGADIPAASKKAKVQPADEGISKHEPEFAEYEALDATEEGKRPLCPICQMILEGTESKCPACGTPLGDERGTPEQTARVDSVPVEEPPEEVGVEEHREFRPCHVCNSIIPKSFERCPICNTIFIETVPKAEEAQPVTKRPKARRPEDSVIPPEETLAPTGRTGSKRRPGSAKVTTVPVETPAKATGRTNGISYVNGLGRASDRGLINGTGVVNGTGFVNGAGPPTGTGRREEGPAARRASRPIRWQMLAALVAILIIIPAFIFFSYSNMGDEFSVDGDYSDWDGATTYGIRFQAPAPSSVITEWAVGAQLSDLFLYFRAESQIMSSPIAECYYLFVDSDGSNSTGYIIESTGADYMLQLTGWDSVVKSTSLLRYASSSDQYNWTAWALVDSLSCSLDGERLEAGAYMPEPVGPSARFVFVSKDSADRGSVSHTAPLKGGVLIVRQAPSADLAATGIVQMATSTQMLKLTFTCEGEGGHVSGINPVLVGASPVYQEIAFPLETGEEQEVVVAVDTSAASDGQLVTAKVLTSSIASTFASVEIFGSGASAYAGSPPSGVVIDGAFADWNGRLSTDHDLSPVANPSTDIDEVGNLSTAQTSFFYLSTDGDICNGTYIPAVVRKPLGAGGGGVIISPRRTAEDILTIYVDSDRSNNTGETVAFDSKRIGADRKIELKGLFGLITSKKQFDYSIALGKWVENTWTFTAAKDDQRIEIGVSTISLGGSVEIDFIVETTSWEGWSDSATFNPASMSTLTRTWIVDPATTSPCATSMSYQRKMFYDGVNHWSLYFDGANTVHKYSVDDGQTWIYGGRVFNTPGVNETSIWYDSSTATVYAVGDTSSASNSVVVQTGKVDATAHMITWAASDSNLKTSSYALAGKNTYISKDLSGYLWVLSSNCSQDKPARYQLNVFMSTEVGSTSSWKNIGQLLPWASDYDNVKGSVLPAGSGSDVWAVYAFQGSVKAMKYTGVWSPESAIYGPAGSTANTDNSPPSVVIDSKGVVHVVYGTGRKSGQASIPQIWYSHSNTDLTFTPGLNLDPANDTRGLANYYPTISLDSSTDDLYVLWLQCDSAFTPKTVMARKCISGTWYGIAIEPQTSFTKQYMTSIYSAPGEYKICWQWTQNTTAPIQVLYDSLWVPELGNLASLVALSAMIVVVCRVRPRKEDEPNR